MMTSDEPTPRRHVLESVLEAMADAAVVADAAGRVLLVNGEAEQLSGYSRGEVVGRDWELLVPDREGQNGERFRRAAAGHAIGLNVRLRRRDGAEVPVRVSLRSLDTADEPRILAVLRDLSLHWDGVRVLLQEERRRIAAEVDEVIRALFSVGMSLQHSALMSRQPEVARGLERDLAVIDAVIRDLRSTIFRLPEKEP